MIGNVGPMANVSCTDARPQPQPAAAFASAVTIRVANSSVGDPIVHGIIICIGCIS